VASVHESGPPDGAEAEVAEMIQRPTQIERAFVLKKGSSRNFGKQRFPIPFIV
jgi:hypothetical protein